MEIVDKVCEYGNYAVRVTNEFDHDGYLYDDASIRLALFPSSKRSVKKLNGFYFSTQDAQAAIDKFKELCGDKPVSHTNKIDNQLRGILDNALTDFVSNGRMFTAYDVTTKVRNDNPGLHVFHTVVKEFVHGEYDGKNGPFTNSPYDRVLTPIASPPPWLYYLPGTHDPNTYQRDGNVKSQPAASVSTSTKNKPKGVFRKAVEAVFGGIRGWDD